MSSDDVKRILPGEKTAGILGGMGPYATVDFYRQILDCTPVKKDWEHIRLITVVLLAVIEHIPEPASFLKMLKAL